jgi:ATP-dependent helicase HrpB
LELSRIARDSAEQRAGRAGRLAPGNCFRLWSAGRQDQLAARSTPEMVEADLADLAMDLAQWGADAMQLAWLDPPPKGALAQARELLTLLEALDESGKITALGRQMAGWPLHPRLAHMLCRAIPLGWAAVACDTAALLSERDVIRSRDTDLLLRLKALQAFRERGRGGANSVGADAEACRRVDQVAKQLRDKVKIPLPSRAEALPRHDGLGGSAAFDTEHALGALLALAYPDRVAARRADGRYRLANGRGAALPEGDGLGREAWLVAAHLDAGEREGRIYLAAALREEDLLRLLADKIQSRDFTGWDEQQACVIARREQRLGQLVISSATLEKPDPDACRAALLSGIRRLDLLPWNDAARALQARAEAARGWFPNENWPNLSDEFLLQNLAAWLSPWIAGMSRLSHLSRLNLLEILQSQLDWPQRRELDEIAPTHLRVPSGSSIALEYPAGQAPVLAVRLQEVFGWQDTPRIGRGQVPVLLHLLSPARRPIQVTQDLRGFWQRTYVEVKKELKGRYPKHYWPDDPLQAIPMRGARPRG